MNNNQQESLSGKNYLEGDYSRELNYKLWSTKGARFIAAERLKTSERMSVISIGLLSSYLIIFNIAEQIIFRECAAYNNKLFFIVNISMSIIILTITLILSKEDYSKRSGSFHQCGLEIGELYSRLRIAKTMGSKNDFRTEVEEINNNYQQILKKYENHSPIDYNKFLSKSRHYPDNHTSNLQSCIFKVIYFSKVYLLHLLIILIPPIILGWTIISFSR